MRSVSTVPLLLSLLLAWFAAALVAALATPLAMRLAWRVGLVAKPRPDRWHRRPTPLLGGLAIAAGFFAVVPWGVAWSPTVIGILAGAVLAVGLGLWDDARGMRADVKLASQIAIACAPLVAGVRIDMIPIAALSLPLAIVWIVGVTNAFNLLDNMDGLAAGVAAVTAATLAVHAALLDQMPVAYVTAALGGATTGFLVFNANPARVFMGDCGSLLLGYTLATVALWGTSSLASNVVLALLVPVAVMALPILDTTLVTLQRLWHGRPVVQGGRDHLSHRLVALGLSERQAVLTLYLIAALAGGLALLATFVFDLLTTVVIGVVLAIAVILFGVFLAEVRVYGDEECACHTARPRTAVLASMLYQRQVVELSLDFVLICVAYLGAYLLKFETTLTGPFMQQFAASLPYVVALKLVAFQVLGVYRPVWRYAGVRDVFFIVRANVVGSLLAVIAVLVVFQFVLFSRSVFVIDWLLLTMLMVSTRLGLVALRDWAARLPRVGARRVLVVGANDRGALTVQTLLRDRRRRYQPVGFIDDDPAKRNRSVCGLPVLGEVHALPTLVQHAQIDEVLVAVPDDALVERVAALCRAAAVPWRLASDDL
jgi:UDP-GlcNAc:undecaprenyl-phosphate GlcNAc-1-phosphate transferase